MWDSKYDNIVFSIDKKYKWNPKKGCCYECIQHQYKDGKYFGKIALQANTCKRVNSKDLYWKLRKMKDIKKLRTEKYTNYFI